MRTYVGDRDGGEPQVLVVERAPYPDPRDVVAFLGDLSRLHDDDSLSAADVVERRAGLMAEKEVLLARIRAAEEPRITPLANHGHNSRTGMDWGQRGPGADDLACSILTHETGETPAAALAQRFADEVVAHLPHDGFRLPASEVGYWRDATHGWQTQPTTPTPTTPADAAIEAEPALAVTDPGLETAVDAPDDEPTASALVAACEEAWKAIQEHHPQLPGAVIVLGSGIEGGRLVKLGHWWSGRWLADGEVRGEVLLAGEALHLPPAAVFEVLLHEAAHGLSAARGVKDTSHGGRYHNARFRNTAEEVGLVVEPMPPYGLARTTLSPEGQDRYAEPITRLADAMRIARQVEAQTMTSAGQGQEASSEGGATRSRTAALAQCPCGRKLRIAPTVLAAGPVLCGLCGAEFAGERPPRRPTEQAEEPDPVVDHTFLARRQSVLDAQAHDTGRISRAVEVLERQWTTLDSALGTVDAAPFAPTLEPLRQRRELVRVLLEELRDEPGIAVPADPESAPTPIQHDGISYLIDAGEVPDDELARWYHRFGTATEQPMPGATDTERNRRTRLARSLLKADGTLTGPAVQLAGQEYMAGERVIVTHDDPAAGVPAGVLGTVEHVHPDDPAISVDFATLGRLKVSVTDSLAGRLRHDYVVPDDTLPPWRNHPSRESLALESQRSAPEAEW